MKIEIIRNSAKIGLVEKLINSLDDLYDDLEYDNSEKEIECIKAKIKIREDLLKQMGKI